MRFQSLARALACAALTGAGLAGCENPQSPAAADNSIANITVTPPAASIASGGTTRLSAAVRESNGAFHDQAPVRWASSRPGIASISSTGIVTAIAPGTTLITAASGGTSGVASITVTQGSASDTSCTASPASVCYYVDGGAGDDASAGTSAQPLRSPQRAAQLVQPGDVVIVRDGIYTAPGAEAILAIARGGTADNPVVFKAEHQWGAVLDGQGNATPAGIAYRASYVRVEGFEVRNVAHDGVDMGVGLKGLQAARLHVHDVGRMCAPPAGWGLSAFTVDDDDVIIEQNLVHDIGRYGPNENGCTPPTPYYQNNDHGIYLSSGTNIVIRNNVFYRLEHGWAIHRYNLEGEAVDQAYIVNNTFAFPNPYRDGQIIVSSPLTNSVIANNIFYQPATAGILFDPGGPMRNVQVTNNLTYGGSVATGPNGGATLTHNLDQTDPHLMNPAAIDFRLSSGSPAIRAGVSLPYVTNDYDGKARAGTDDLGALQF